MQANETVIIHTDGGARGNPGPAGIGVVIETESGEVLELTGRYIGQATNNVAEYKALILALERAKVLGLKKVKIFMDSELVVRQMQGRYKIKEPTLQKLAALVLTLKNHFSSLDFYHVLREKNKLADKLVNDSIDEALG